MDQNDQNDQNIADEIGRVSKDSAESLRKAAIAARNLEVTFLGLKNVVSNTTSAFLDTSTEFKKFNKVVDSSTRLLSHLSLNIIGGKTGAIANIINSSVGAAIKSFFSFEDSILKSYDNMAQFGGALSVTTDDVLELIHSAGYYTAKSDAFNKAMSDIGSAFLNIESTASEGAKTFGYMLDTSDIRDGFIRLGYTQEAVTKAQVDYVKLQESLGISLKRDNGRMYLSASDYLTSVAALSDLTGESRDKVAETLASQLADYKFNLTLQNLIEQGRGDDAQRLLDTVTAVEMKFGKKVALGVKDFIVNGTATIKEGEAVLTTLGTDITAWARNLKSDKNSMAPFLRNISNGIINFGKYNADVLGMSDEFRNQTIVDAQSMRAAYQMRNVQDIGQVVDILKKTVNEQSDTIKNAQIGQLDAEREAGQLADIARKSIEGPINSGLRGLIWTITKTTKLMAELARFVGNLVGLPTPEAFDKAMQALGDSEELQKLAKDLEKDAKDIEKKIKQQKDLGDVSAKAKESYEKALEEQKKLRERKNTGGVSAQEELSIQQNVEATLAALQKARQREKEKYGTTTEELQGKRQSLIRRSKEASESAITKQQGELAEQDTEKKKEQKKRELESLEKALERSNLDKFLHFDSSGSGDVGHFLSLAEKNPELAGKVAKLAEEYYKISGEKLHITSSYRSKEEQQAIYQKWKDAKGDYDTKPYAAGYYIPSKNSSSHTFYRAVDIKPEQLDAIGNSILSKFGLQRPNPKDPVHVTLKRDQTARLGEDQVQALNPDFIAHGREAIVPMLDGNTVGMEMKSPVQSNDFSDFKTDIKKIKPDDSLVQQFADIKPNKQLIDYLVSKIDDLAVAIDQSTSVQNDIKLYSMS